jgi:hypothetical protein
MIARFGYSRWNFYQTRHLIEQNKLPGQRPKYSRESVIQIFYSPHENA